MCLLHGDETTFILNPNICRMNSLQSPSLLTFLYKSIVLFSPIESTPTSQHGDTSFHSCSIVAVVLFLIISYMNAFNIDNLISCCRVFVFVKKNSMKHTYIYSTFAWQSHFLHHVKSPTIGYCDGWYSSVNESE